jgi:hypothetical protein
MDATVFTTLIATAGAVVGAIAGGVLVGGATLFIDNRSEGRKRRVAMLQLQAKLRAAFTPLQFAFDNGEISLSHLLSALRGYIAVASQPEVLAYIQDDNTAKWTTNSASVFEVALLRLMNEGEFYSSGKGSAVIPDDIRSTAILGALSVAASTMTALGDRDYLEENASQSVRAAVTELTTKHRAARAGMGR